MQRPTDPSNADHASRLLDLLPDTTSEGFGSAMLRMAHAAAALHRMEEARQAQPWQGLVRVELQPQDKAEQGRFADARSARDRGPVTTEGDR